MSACRLVTAIVSILALTGCFPVRTTVTPEVSFAVSDPSGAPIAGAQVNFARYSISFMTRHQIVQMTTDRSGRAATQQEGMWQVLVLAPDGFATFYSWSWCIEKPGYAVVYRNNLRDSGVRELEAIKLPRSEKRETCKWLDAPYRFEATSAL